MLSINFYECEEVCLALMDSLRFGRSKEAVYWAYELQLSMEHELLEKTIIRAWLIYLGPKHINWLDAWFASSGPLVCLELIAEFCGLMGWHAKRPSAMLKTFYIACRGFSEVIDMGRVEAGVAANDPFSVYWWIGPGYEKSPTALLEYIAAFVDDGGIFDSLRKAMAVIGSLQMKILLGAVSVQVLCLSSYPEPYCKTADIGVGTWVEEWDAVACSTKARRIYPIKESMLLHGGGRVTQDIGLNIGWRMILGERGSAFWKAQLSRITDDESQETVYAELFPDDIPDEWGLEAKNLSHPVKSDRYTVFMKNTYRFTLVWGRLPVVIRKSWDGRLKALLKASWFPDK